MPDAVRHSVSPVSPLGRTVRRRFTTYNHQHVERSSVPGAHIIAYLVSFLFPCKAAEAQLRPWRRATTQLNEVSSLQDINSLSAILDRGESAGDAVVVLGSAALNADSNNMLVVSNEASTVAAGSAEVNSLTPTPPEPNQGPKVTTLEIPGTVSASGVRPDYTSQDSSFATYVSICLHGLRSCAQALRVDTAGYDDNIRDLGSFIVSHHSKKLAAKINTIRYMWFKRETDDAPPPVRLCDWKPSTSAEQDEDFVFPDDPQFSYYLDRNPAFSKRPVPQQPSQSQRVVAARDSIAFPNTLLSLLNSLERYLDRQSFAAAAQALATMHVFVQSIPVQFWRSHGTMQIFSEIDYDFEDLRHVAVPVNESSIDSDEWIPESCKQFIRSFDSLCSVVSATQYLTQRQAFYAPVPFNVSVISTSIGATLEIPSQAVEVRAVVEHWYKGNQISKIDISLLYDEITNNLNIRGSCHCEASILAALLTEDSSEDMREVNPTLFPGDRVIGLSKKPCPICYCLCEVLNVQHDLKVSLPSPHKVYSTWIPPAWLPVYDLGQLEARLLEKLRAMCSLIADHDKSRTLPPASSDSDIHHPWFASADGPITIDLE
ncbi:hypothetical protein EIP91_011883 [Steccherinum ochraceum]|uniref:Uncharacterized protein n=1 Tax=Steccherinum ochraceum TaxID=92696 RepID=A0A4R0RHK4_9APHY|nr:hypothetical protein EIP91_011883 [Steccherinum ochraceum]